MNLYKSILTLFFRILWYGLIVILTLFLVIYFQQKKASKKEVSFNKMVSTIIKYTEKKSVWD